jgi:hypothetical protein
MAPGLLSDFGSARVGSHHSSILYQSDAHPNRHTINDPHKETDSPNTMTQDKDKTYPTVQHQPQLTPVLRNRNAPSELEQRSTGHVALKNVRIQRRAACCSAALNTSAQKPPGKLQPTRPTIDSQGDRTVHG